MVQVPHNTLHTSVLLKETLIGLAPIDNGVYVDGTFGTGGVTRALLDTTTCHVLAIDRDPDVLSIGYALADQYPGRVTMRQGCFGDLEEVLRRHAIPNVDGIVFDLGVSTCQLTTPERGFSFRVDGPLDMRMARIGRTAQEVVNTLSESMLVRVLFDYGEERHARRIARAVVEARTREPILRTLQLADIVRKAIRQKKQPIDAATRTFQALRIYVNNEMQELERGLLAAEKVLRPGGRLVVICFHSLEDRMVKTFLRQRSERIAVPSRHIPYDPQAYQIAASFREVVHKPIRPTKAEIMVNPCARSARLRLMERTQAPPRPLS